MPTTEYITRTSPTTIWQTSTYTTTTTFTTEYPVTITSDHTVITTSISTEYETVVTTLTTSVPVVSYTTEYETVTGPGQTVTQPGETVTQPGETITQPGETITEPAKTVTLPAQTTTLPGSTITTTIVEEGETVTTTVSVPPTTITQPGQVVTVTKKFEVSLCPSLTGAEAPLQTDSDLTFGCKPGYVCDPPMPDGCNFWPAPPSKDYLCKPEHCRLAPPVTTVEWDEGETGYFPPSNGYFNLNPNMFGLSYDIFEYEVYTVEEHGEIHTRTTGNWESQASLSDWPLSTTTTSEPKPYRQLLRRILGKRDTGPAVCFDTCNNLVLNAQSVGKSDALCEDDSVFRNTLTVCTTCIEKNEGTSKDTIRDNVEPEYVQWLDFCSGSEASTTATSATAPESAITGDPDVSSTSQIEISSGTVEPIEPSTTSTEDEPTTEPSTVPTPTATTGESTTTAEEPTSGSTTVEEGQTSGTTTTVEETGTSPSSSIEDSTTVDSTTVEESATETATGDATETPTETAAETTATETDTETATETIVTETTAIGGSETSPTPSGSTTAGEPSTTDITSTAGVSGGSSATDGTTELSGEPSGSPIPGVSSWTTSGTFTIPVIPSGTDDSPPDTVPTAAASRSAAGFTLGASLLSILAIFFA